ncbi:hypothetical protein ACIA6C_15295 [Streptomyces sp. NPDC051578]|uniref:hypothetical protein n=1 Tax=Streptomyces sp. NPDC051578 TaxID=3365662 RepID=UPI0037A6EDBE
MTTSTEQIAGETGALDLMRGGTSPLTRKPSLPPRRRAPWPDHGRLMHQRGSGLLTESVLAGPDFFPCRRVVMGPADIEWLESIPMETAVAEALLVLAGDGATPRLALDDAQLATVFALSAVARCVAVYGREGATNSPPSSVRRGP